MSVIDFTVSINDMDAVWYPQDLEGCQRVIFAKVVLAPRRFMRLFEACSRVPMLSVVSTLLDLLWARFSFCPRW